MTQATRYISPAYYMKNSPLTKALLVLVVVVSLWSVYTCLLYNSKSRELRMMQTQVGIINYRQQVVQALLAEAMEYSKKNPAIDPILEAAGAKPPRTNPPSATKPASK
jgi:hypothetical protein